MVRCVTDRGSTVEATADRFQVDAKTVRKWRDRFLAGGDDALADRSSRPHRSPNRTPRQLRRKVLRISKKRRWCAEFQAKLDATPDRGVFADTPWIPGELKETVNYALGCNSLPEPPEDACRPPPTTDPGASGV
jgi:transposase-like protein